MTDINKIEREGKAMAHLLCAALGEPEEGVQRVVREIAKILYTRTDLAGVVEFGNFIKDDPTMVHAAGWTLRKGKEEKAQDCTWLFDCIQEFWDADRELTRSRLEAGEKFNLAQAKINYMEERKIMMRRWLDRALAEQGLPPVDEEAWRKACSGD
jgi:hypothetical protein